MNYAAKGCPARSEADAQPAREQNIAAIIAYFESGIKDSCENVGIELEHTIVRGEDKTPVSYSDEHGVHWILSQLQEDYPTPLMDGSDLIGVVRPWEAITIEPAAQLEISAGPFNDMPTAHTALDTFERKLEDILRPQGMQALLLGYHPTAKALDLELIPKRRYRFMNDYFEKIGPFGQRMMRGSCSTQVSIDYDSTDDCLRKMHLASALVPLLSFISDNASAFEGRPREHYLVRTEIWNECDPDRCRLVPGVLDPDFNLRRYAAYILDTPAILVPDASERWRATSQTFGEVYAETPMTRADVEHALSMFFNDVRLKTYVEIRPADAMPVPYAVAYASLVKGLFYDEDNVERWLSRFAAVTNADVVRAKADLMEHGWDAKVYGTEIGTLLDDLIADARKGLPETDRSYLEPLAKLVASRITLAEIAARTA